MLLLNGQIFSLCWELERLQSTKNRIQSSKHHQKAQNLYIGLTVFVCAASKSNQLLLWFFIPDSSFPKCEIFLVGEYDWCWVGEPLCLRILSSLWMCVFAALLVKVMVSQKHVEEALSAMVCVYIWYIFNLLSPAPISNCIFSSMFCHVYKMLVGRI